MTILKGALLNSLNYLWTVKYFKFLGELRDSRINYHAISGSGFKTIREQKNHSFVSNITGQY